MTANVELLNKVMDRISSAPGNWDQRNWCNCFAGHTAQALGYTTEKVVDSGFFPESRAVKDGEARNIPALAGQVLGLTRDERYELFDASNSLADLRSIVSRITQREIDSEVAILDARFELV